MSGLDLNQFADKASSLVGLFAAPPRRVSEADVPLTPEPESAFVNPFSELARGDAPAPGGDRPGAYSAQPTGQPPGVGYRPYGYDPEQDAYIPLTQDEMDAKAEAKVEMYAAIIAIFSTLVNSWAVQKSTLQKGDKELIRAHSRKKAKNNVEPAYAPDHPYHAARERYETLEAELKEIEGKAQLSDAQKNLLFRAIYADIKAKDLQRRLRNAGVLETVGEIATAKIIESAMTALITFSTRSFR